MANATGVVDRLGQPYSEAALKVLQERYLEPDETIDGMYRRVARTVAVAETINAATWRDEFEDMMAKRQFMPNSPLLANAGKPDMCYSACFVLPVEDDLPSIMETGKNAAIIHKSGGGTGFSFSRLRPKGSRVGSTNNGVASGPVGFLRMYDAITEEIKQGGSRRGANMGILHIDHPDILEFIDCKRSGGITNFNISVGMTNEFMTMLTAHEYDSTWMVTDPQTLKSTYLQEAGQPVTVGQLWRKLVEAAWATGDPGMVFLDRMNESKANPTPSLWQIEATNPCGEQPLGPFDVCNLGSINLSKFVDHLEVDRTELKRVVTLATRFLDNVIDVNNYPLPQIEDMAKGLRRIGLGVMGWHDMLMQLHIPYASKEAVKLGTDVMRLVTNTALEASIELAHARGPFPFWKESIYYPSPLLRNAARTTIAPTGTISLIADCSSGIEPVFALEFEHNNQQGRSMTVRNWVFEQSPVSGYPKDVWGPSDKAIFCTAHDISPEWHVKHQAAFQAATDNAVSKTINLPHDATVEDVEKCYRQAWDSDCLGITIYRDGSKGAQVLNVKVEPKKVDALDSAIVRLEAQIEDVTPETDPQLAAFKGFRNAATIKTRPPIMHGYTAQVKAPEGTVNITINSDEDGPLEVFVNVGRAGSDIVAMAEAIGRLISFNLRMPSSLNQRAKMQEMADQLRNIGGSRTVGFGDKQVRSLSDAVAKTLDAHLRNSVTAEIECDDSEYVALVKKDGGTVFPSNLGNLCPSCGAYSLVYEEGCKKCHSCGFSMC